MGSFADSTRIAIQSSTKSNQTSTESGYRSWIHPRRAWASATCVITTSTAESLPALRRTTPLRRPYLSESDARAKKIPREVQEMRPLPGQNPGWSRETDSAGALDLFERGAVPSQLGAGGLGAPADPSDRDVEWGGAGPGEERPVGPASRPAPPLVSSVALGQSFIGRKPVRARPLVGQADAAR